MRYSSYNHLVKMENEDTWILYNFLSGALVKLDITNKEIFDGILNDVNHINEKMFLEQNGFLVDFDELAFIRTMNKKSCVDESTLAILIAPTMGCNFACPYCFEEHHSGFMPQSVQEKIIQFIASSVEKNHHKHIFVYWFGGEPLLAPNIIESMSNKIMAIAAENSITYSSAVVTNGSLLTKSVLKMLETHCVERIQVTLDGVGEINDITRVQKDGSGTFDIIVNNLSEKTPIEIIIRCNISRNNINNYKQLREYLEVFNETHGTCLRLYPARMEIYPNSKTNVTEQLSQEEFFSYLGENGLLSTQKIKDSKFVACTAERFHSYAFDEKGNVYRCWNDVGNVAMAFSTVDDLITENHTIVARNVIPYLDNGYQFDEECKTCKILPICMGGCIMKRNFMGEKVCSPIKFHPDFYVLKKYFQETRKINNTERSDFNDTDC